MANRVYLSINYDDGVLYEYSKTKKTDDFKEHTYDGKTSYRKYYNKGIYGVYKGVFKNKGKFGDEYSVVMVDGDTEYRVNIPVMRAGGIEFTDYAAGILAYLPNMKKGDEYRIYTYSFIPEGTSYKRTGVSVKTASVSEREVTGDVERVFSYTSSENFEEGNPNLVPPLEWKNNKPTAMSKAARCEFFEEWEQKVFQALERAQTTPPTTQKEDEPEDPVTKGQDDIDDDLPF